MRFLLPPLLISGVFLSALPMALAQSSEDADSEVLRSTGPRPAGGQEVNVKRVGELIVEATNDFRQQHELQPVTTNSELQDAARYFARYMAKRDEYGHKADGNRPADRAEQHGYRYCIVLENIAYQYSSRGFGNKELARKFERGWEQSPGHRKNMLDPDITETGVAVWQSEESGYFYAVQMFGRPKSEQIRFEISNKAAEEVTYDLDGKEYPLAPRQTRIHFRCRPAELMIQLEEDRSESLTPEAGDNLVIVQQGGELTVQRR